MSGGWAARAAQSCSCCCTSSGRSFSSGRQRLRDTTFCQASMSK